MVEFLDSLFGGPTEVYIAISTTNLIELGVLDPHTNIIKSYINASIDYNEARREIQDYDQFSAKVAKMFELCNLQPSKCNVHISIPTVWFGYKDNIPIESDSENIKNIVLSELDQTFIFKRTDPVPFWFDAPPSLETNSKSIFYTALQTDVVDNYRKIFKDMGVNLIEITCSLISDVKGLYTYGFTEEEMDSDTSWSLMIVNNSGFQLYDFQGKKLSNYSEEPLAIKSFEQDDEKYSAIAHSAQVFLMSSAAKSLVIVSETNFVSASELSKKIQFEGKVTVIEDGGLRKKPLCDLTRALIPEMQPDVTLHLLGMFPPASTLPIAINFLLCIEGYARNDILELPFGNDLVITFTRPKAMLCSIIFLIALSAPFGLLMLGTNMINQRYTSRIEELDSEINDVSNKLKKYESKTTSDFSPYREIEKVVKYNRTKIMAYSALGDSIPQNLYLSYFMTGDNGLVDIQGYSNTVEDVYVFFQNLKDYLLDSNLRLSKLDLKTGSLEDVIENSSSNISSPYVFEITNMDEGQLSAFMNTLKNNADGKKQDPKNSQDKKN